MRGGRLPAVEQAGFRKKSDARADASDVGAAGVPLLRSHGSSGVFFAI